jgi:hypothetical protein
MICVQSPARSAWLSAAQIRRSGRTSDPRPDHARWLAPIWARCASIRLIRGGFWTVRRSSAERADVIDLAPAGVTAVSLRRLAGWLPHRLSPPFGGKRILRTGGGTSSGSREPRVTQARQSFSQWLAGGTFYCLPSGPATRPPQAGLPALLVGRRRRRPTLGAHSKKHAQRHDPDREPPAVVGDSPGRDDRVVT